MTTTGTPRLEKKYSYLERGERTFFTGAAKICLIISKVFKTKSCCGDLEKKIDINLLMHLVRTVFIIKLVG